MRKGWLPSFGGGALIGTVGGLMGLGGAEFRLPLLIGFFRFEALEAVILNKALSLVVVISALLFRMRVVSLDAILAHSDIVLNLLAGSLLGAWVGAGWAMRLKSSALHRVIAVLLLVIAGILLFGHDRSAFGSTEGLLLTGVAQKLAGGIAGVVIGVFASLLGVAGGEMLIPTLVLLFGCDMKLAGSLSLAVSLPTMLVGFSRYSQDASFAVLGQNRRFMLIMALGSLAGAFIGGLLLGVIPDAVLLPMLSAMLVLSAIKIFRHA